MFQRKNLWIIHVLAWLLFLVLPVTIMSREPDPSIQITLLTSASFWLFFLIYCFIFYFNILILIPTLFLKHRHLIYTSLFLTGFLLILYTQPFENLIFKRFHNAQSQPPDAGNEMFRRTPPGSSLRPNGPTPFSMPSARNGHQTKTPVDFVSLVLFVVVWVAAMATKISEQWRISEQRAILSEADKAQAELSFFKAQINPHFLFNTLNNIYALAVSHHENTAPSILKLSEMMRYITEEATEDFVPIEDEIACLENYVDLQKLRLNAKTKVEFECKGDFSNIKIPPLILMTFVENAFKYGVSNRFENMIEIRLNAFEKTVLFLCNNQIFEGNNDQERKGIGIENTKKRLDFLYADGYNLEIDQKEKTFEVHLELRTGS